MFCQANFIRYLCQHFYSPRNINSPGYHLGCSANSDPASTADNGFEKEYPWPYLQCRFFSNTSWSIGFTPSATTSKRKFNAIGKIVSAISLSFPVPVLLM